MRVESVASNKSATRSRCQWWTAVDDCNPPSYAWVIGSISIAAPPKTCHYQALQRGGWSSLFSVATSSGSNVPEMSPTIRAACHKLASIVWPYRRRGTTQIMNPETGHAYSRRGRAPAHRAFPVRLSQRSALRCIEQPRIRRLPGAPATTIGTRSRCSLKPAPLLLHSVTHSR
jgi:hypothetical protein